MPKCNGEECGYVGEADTFDGCATPYHDMRCPKCGTTDVDTSDINKEWAGRGEEYGYGDGNSLRVRKL